MSNNQRLPASQNDQPPLTAHVPLQIAGQTGSAILPWSYAPVGWRTHPKCLGRVLRLKPIFASNLEAHKSWLSIWVSFHSSSFIASWVPEKKPAWEKSFIRFIQHPSIPGDRSSFGLVWSVRTPMAIPQKYTEMTNWSAMNSTKHPTLQLNDPSCQLIDQSLASWLYHCIGVLEITETHSLSVMW